MTKLTRRTLLKGAATAGVGLVAGGIANAETLAARPEQATDAANQPATPQAGATVNGRIVPLTSTSDVFIPPRGRDFMKFSFDFPEPSVEYEGHQFSFRIYTFENTYGLDATQLTAEEKEGTLTLHCSLFVWAGQQHKAPGHLTAWLRKTGDFIELHAEASMDQPIKSIAAIVRGVPRAKRMSAGGENFFDLEDNEILVSYPFGTGDAAGAHGVSTPLVVLQNGDRDFYSLSARIEQVRACRFYFQPGPNGYRVEMVYEREAWKKAKTIESCVWRIGKSDSLEAACRPHYEHIEKVFQVPDWEKRTDMPGWVREVSLVVALHGMHWTGYIFNDFAKMLEILQWVGGRIPGNRVLVFLPAWDGRYYWNYPLYEPDKDLGGEEGFRALMDKGHALGFRFMPMFGLNSANDRLKPYAQFADAATIQIDGDPYYINRVDWDNDRHDEGWMPFMNIGVASWRNWLQGRIADVVERFHADAYFLDISGRWINNPQADMHAGIRQMVEGLRTKYPGVLACGEYYYDALLSFLPLFQIFSQQAYPAALHKYGRVFSHLSHPAPGRGSSGVHESGFSHFNEQTLSLDDIDIPTITVVDDTFDRYREDMAKIIDRAKQRAGIS